MRRLDRYVSQAVVDATVDVFLSDWGHQHPDIAIEIRDVDLDEACMMVKVKMRVDVYDREVNVLLYADTHTAADHIYEALWKEASK